MTYASVHLFLGELADVLDGLGGALLELDALQSLVQVQSVVAASWLQFGFLYHLLLSLSLFINNKIIYDCPPPFQRSS